MLPYVAISCAKLACIALRLKVEFLAVVVVVGGRWCKRITVSTQLSLNCVRLFWGCLGVVLWLSCGFDNILLEKVDEYSTHATAKDL